MYPDSNLSRLISRSNWSYSPGSSWNSSHGYEWIVRPALMSLKSARIRRILVAGFSSVSGGVKGACTTLEGGVICLFSLGRVRDIDIPVCCNASERCVVDIVRACQDPASQTGAFT